MSSATPLTDRRDLEAIFAELAQELSATGATGEVVMVGGSWLLWHGHRAATRDVDSAKPLSDAVRTAVRSVAGRNGLPDDWLNDRAAMFWPANADLEDCSVVYAADGLVVKTPPARVVFVMKLYRAHPQDYDDMVMLWSGCGFNGSGAARDAFWRAYPHAPDDEFLVDFITDIATEAGR